MSDPISASLSIEDVARVVQHPDFLQQLQAIQATGRTQRAQLLQQLRTIDPDKLSKISFRTTNQADGFSDAFGDSFADSSARQRLLDRLRSIPADQLVDVQFSTEGKLRVGRG